MRGPKRHALRVIPQLSSRVRSLPPLGGMGGFTFPLDAVTVCPVQATEGIHSEGSEERSEPLRAIVADDDAFARRMIKDALQGAGIIVIAEAQNGREAVELTLFYRPTIVVMDVVMPGVDGIAATRQM